MSSLQKQSPKRRGKKGSKSLHSNSPWLRGLMLAVRTPLRGVGLVVRFFLRFPRFAFGSMVLLLLFFGGWWAASRLGETVNGLVPRRLSVECPDTALQNRVMRIASITMGETRKNGWNREQMMRRLEERINAIENLDSATLHAGLDGTLQIAAAPQAPRLVLELSEEQKLIIGNRMTVIGKLPSPISVTGLPWIVAPEGKITTLATPAGSTATQKKNLVVGINLPWLFSAVQTILSENRTFSTAGFSVDRFFWRSTAGISLKISTTKRPAPAPSPGATPGAPPEPPTTVTVVLGDADLAARTKKLREMLVDFSARGVVPEFIDLNYPDKAIVRLKVSEAPTEPKL
jgi:hypothetical protein